MGLFKKILSRFNGLRYPQEYLCLGRESFEKPLHANLFSGGMFIKDITNEHLFVGYSPLLIVLYSHVDDKMDLSDEIEIRLDTIATLSLKLTRRQAAGNYILYYFEGIGGSHEFSSPFNQAIHSWYNRRFNNYPGNVFLNTGLYKQVQIAYAIPRVISLVTVSDGALFNVFPTDLHGPVANEYYIESLRHGGEACRQVMNAGKMLLSDIHASAYRSVYALGKNHMQPLKEKSHFPLTDQVSENFKLPIPQSALNYRELELIDSFEQGIHRLMLFKIIFMKEFPVAKDSLAHIHNVYASWRLKTGLPGNYLLR